MHKVDKSSKITRIFNIFVNVLWPLSPDLVCCLPGVVVVVGVYYLAACPLSGSFAGVGNASETDSGVNWVRLSCLSERVMLRLRSQLGVARSLGSLRLPHVWFP